MSHSDQSYSAQFQLSDNRADFVVVKVEEGQLVVRDCNGAALLTLAPPSATGVAIWQLASHIGISYAPLFGGRR